MAATHVKLLALCYTLGLAGCPSSPAWFQNISTNLFSMAGDISLGGLFPINMLTSDPSQRTEVHNISCNRIYEQGLALALVMKYTVDEINADPTLLPGLKLGFETFDTCKHPAVLVESTLFLLTEDTTEELTVKCNYTDYQTRVAAIIGPSNSDMVSAIGELLGFFLMPTISYLATSDKFSNEFLYPSFLRTVPTDKWQAEAIVHLMEEFEWKWVAVVASDDDYGREGQREISAMAHNSSICVAYEGLIPMYTGTRHMISKILDTITRTKVKVVVVFAQAATAEPFFIEVIRRNLTGVWIASAAWALHPYVKTLANIHKIGTVIGFTVTTQTLGLLASYTQELFTRVKEEKRRPPPAPESAAATIHRNPCPQCWSLSPDNISMVTEPLIQYQAFGVYAAIYSVAQALHIMLKCNATNCAWGPESKIYPWQLLEVIKNVSVELNGTSFTFDKGGNPNIGYNIVQWMWRENKGVHVQKVGTFYQTFSINRTLMKWHTEKVPVSTCSDECRSGQVRRVKGFHSCCFDCIDCLEGTYRAKREDNRCTPCPRGQWSHFRSDRCTEPTFDVLSWEQPASVALMVAGAVLLVCQGSVGVLLLKNRGTPLVSASGGVLSGVALLGLMGGCLSLLLFLGQPGDLVCRLQVTLPSIFHTAALSVIVAVSLQIFYVAEFPQKAASHLDALRGLGGWLIVLLCCGVQAGICGWYIRTGPSLSEDLAEMNINFLEAFLSCPLKPKFGFYLSHGFNVVLSLISFMCTFMAVQPVRQYNLARDITFSTLIYCVIWVTFIPIVPVRSHHQLKHVIYMSFSLLSNLGLMAAYFFPKCYMLLKNPDQNTLEHFRTFLEGAPPTPQNESEPQPQPRLEVDEQPESSTETQH